MQNNNLKGKIAVISGCNKGIGKAINERLMRAEIK